LPLGPRALQQSQRRVPLVVPRFCPR
jgi:hypothetical protein